VSVSASLEAKISVPLDLKSLGFGLNLGMENFISVSVSTNWSRSTSLDLALSLRISRDLVSSGPIASLPLPSPRSFYRARRRRSRDQSVGHVVRSLCKRRRHCQHELHQHSTVFFDTAHILNKVKISKSASK